VSERKHKGALVCRKAAEIQSSGAEGTEEKAAAWDEEKILDLGRSSNRGRWAQGKRRARGLRKRIWIATTGGVEKKPKQVQPLNKPWVKKKALSSTASGRKKPGG